MIWEEKQWSCSKEPTGTMTLALSTHRVSPVNSCNKLWCGLPGPAEAYPSRDSQASGREYSGRSHTWAVVHDCQPWGPPIPETESCGSGPCSSSEWWSEPKFFPVWDISLCWLCHRQDLKVFLYSWTGPYSSWVTDHPEGCSLGFLWLLPSSHGARAALVLLLPAGALPRLHPPGLWAPKFQ